MNDPFTCRSCGSNNSKAILDLGNQPLANNLLNEENLNYPEPRFPLELFVCQHCWLLQIGATVPPVDLFSDYLYFSSFSETMLNHAAKAAEQYTASFDLGSESMVVEVASNDGYLLKNFQTAGIPCLGIEPAANIASVARDNGIDTLEKFFTLETAKSIVAEQGEADLILGNNVFAHAPDTNDFTSGLAHLLKADGRIILEFPYAMDFIEKNEFDTIYHEHIFYFSLTALISLFNRHNLEIIQVERLSIHGGSLRLFAAIKGGPSPPDDSVQKLLQLEKVSGVQSLEYYHEFANKAARVREELVALLAELSSKGKSIAAYGASAKGSTLLNFCDIDFGQIDFIIDRSTHKQGKFSPGLHLPILPTDELKKRQPDYALVLTWNFIDEIIAQQQDYLTNGGQFIVPIPQPRILKRQ